MSKIIYIIDDKPDELESLFQLLQKLEPSWQVKAYSQPELLLEETRKSRPHLILADDFMPTERGSELLDRVRRSLPPDGARSHLGPHHKFGEAGRGTPIPGKTVQSRGDPLRFGCPKSASRTPISGEL